MCYSDYNLYTLPTIHFVGGETQDFLYNIYFYKNGRAVSLSSCSANFSVISYTNRRGAPVISKTMEILYNEEAGVDNILKVTLDPSDTLELSGKFIYQIIIKDVGGDAEIPKQGIIYISNNINKNFLQATV